MRQVTVGGVQVIYYEADVMPATGQAIRKRRFLRPKYEQGCVARRQHSLVAIIAHNSHTQHLAKKRLRILAVRHYNRQVVKAKVGPPRLLRACRRLLQWHGLHMESMRLKMRHAFPDEHVGKYFGSLRRLNAN